MQTPTGKLLWDPICRGSFFAFEGRMAQRLGFYFVPLLVIGSLTSQVPHWIVLYWWLDAAGCFVRARVALLL